MNKLPPILAGVRRVLFLQLVGNGVARAASAIASLLLLRVAFDGVLEGSGVAARDLLVAGGLVGSVLVVAWLHVVERVQAERLGQEYVADVRLRIFDRLAVLPARRLQRRGRGVLMLRFVTDLTGLRQWLSRGLPRLVVGSITAAGALGALTVLEPGLGLLTSGLLVAAALVTAALLGPLRRRTRELRRRRGQLANSVGENLASLAVVQLFGQEGRERARLEKQSRRVVDASVQRALVAGATQAVPAAAVGAAVVGILVASASGWVGEVSSGTTVAAIAIVAFLGTQLQDLANSFVHWNNYQIARAKIEQLLEDPFYMDGPARTPHERPITGAIAFERAGVKGSLHGVSAEAAPRTVVAVTGPTGAGKSTLLALAARLFDADEGAVLLDREDIRSFEIHNLRGSVGLLSPLLPLLRGSVRRNILYRTPGASPDEVERVRNVCGLDELLSTLPDGDGFRVLDGGANLPAGLRQRIALARCLLGDPKVLLLDEPDTGMDPGGREVIGDLVRRRASTTLLVTNDVARVRSCDVVWHMHEGRIVEQGHPDAVLAGDGPAARFFRDAAASSMGLRPFDQALRERTAGTRR